MMTGRVIVRALGVLRLGLSQFLAPKVKILASAGLDVRYAKELHYSGRLEGTASLTAEEVVGHLTS